MSENFKNTFATIVGIVVLFTWFKLSIIQQEQILLKSSQHHIINRKRNNLAICNNYFDKNLEGPGVILSTKGGIGNQLFQYACSYALARKRKSVLYNFIIRKNNTTKELFSEDRKFSPSTREYALDNFQVPLNNFIDKTTKINSSLVQYLSDSQFFYGNFTNKDFLQLNGDAYCQSETYWFEYKEEIISMFQLKPEVVREFPSYVINLEKEITNSKESVAVHVRRGDFTRITGFEVPISYQRSAIRRIVKILKSRYKNSTSNGSSPLPKFFIFSDDIDYTKKKFSDFAKVYDFVFVSGSSKSDNRTSSLQDFYLMTKCKHFIIPNSTFAWWVAYLSTNGKRQNEIGPHNDRIVIASTFNPKFWRLWKENKKQQKFYMMLHGQKYHPKEWIVINPFVGET